MGGITLPLARLVSVSHAPPTSVVRPDMSHLLPRFRTANPLADRAHMERRQAQVLTEALDADPSRKMPLRFELTKPGDPLALRGVPLVGAAAGAISHTQPENETVRRISQRERINERAA